MSRAAWALVALTACRTIPSAERGVVLSADGYLTGEPAAFGAPVVLNREDYVYDAELSNDSSRLAVSRLGAKNFYLSLFTLATSKRDADVAVNGYELDVESLAWAPDGSWLAVVSRDGALRLYDALGAPKTGWLSDEKLTAVAVHPDGRSLAVGSERGRVTLLTVDAAGLRFAHELRLHGDEVRALEFAPDGRLFSASWDKTVHVTRVASHRVRQTSAQVHVERTATGAVVRAVVQGKASAPLALDARVPAAVVMRTRLAQSAGIDAATLLDSVTVPTALGNTLGRVAHDVSLSFKGLSLEHLDAIVCDACVPADVEGVLGEGFSARVELVFDDATHEVVLSLKGGDAAEREVLQLDEVARFEFEACVNDLSLDRAGDKLGLALSQAKAQRNMDVYQREKRHEVEPEREWDAAVIADAATGRVLEKFHGHHGVVSTAALSPDGATLISGGWDHRLLLHDRLQPDALELGGLIRRVRFSRDGRLVSVAAWTPQNALGDHQSQPAALVIPLGYRAAAPR